MRVLTIDIGTNSTLSLIADIDASSLTVVERDIAGNGLGAEMTSEGIITEELLAENREILTQLHKRGVDLGCERFYAVGTQALRSAKNAAEFAAMSRSVGIPLDIVSADEEAQLAWSGVFGANSPEKDVCIIDLGGGSTELMIGSGLRYEWSNSVSIGAVSLARSCFRHNPPEAGEIDEARTAVRKGFKLWSDRDFSSAIIIGVAGTVVALAAVEYQLEFTPGILENKILTLRQVSEWSDQLLKLNATQRSEIPFMPAARAGSIHAGALILSEIMRICQWESIVVSERGVLFGAAWKIASS